MYIAMTIPEAGAGKWCWTGWMNAFDFLNYKGANIGSGPHNSLLCSLPKVDLLICSTSCPSENILEWRKHSPDAKVALNVLAWTDDDWAGINNPGVQASQGNIEYARKLKPDIVFAQYSKKYAESLLRNWHEKEGYKLGSMAMAADSTVYTGLQPIEGAKEIVYTGGYWPYKAQNINKYLLPLLMKYRDRTTLVGKGWPVRTDNDPGENAIASLFYSSKLCPNAHEPHSTLGGFDVVERVFKTMYCGGLCLSDYVREIEEGFGLLDGVHLKLAKTPDEYLNIAEDILKYPEKYDTIRQRGTIEVRDKHTYINRCRVLLSDLGF